jgi:hypothetical protein
MLLRLLWRDSSRRPTRLVRDLAVVAYVRGRVRERLVAPDDSSHRQTGPSSVRLSLYHHLALLEISRLTPRSLSIVSLPFNSNPSLRQPGTQKVHDALRPPYHQQVSIVHPAWIYDSIAHWTQLATTEYDLIPASTTPPGSPDKPNAASSSSSLPPTAAAATDVPEELIGEVELGEIDIWGQADKELEAFLEESDEDESEAEADGEDASEASRSNQPANGLDK